MRKHKHTYKVIDKYIKQLYMKRKNEKYKNKW